MRNHNILSTCAFLLLGGWLVCANANAAIEVIGTQYRQDLMFPEFDCYWNASAFPNACASNRPGATVHAYLKNTGASAVTLDDATLAGHSLKTIIKRAGAGWNADLKMNSIYFQWDNPPQDILDAGEPIWYRFDPPTVPAGGVAQLAVRLRYVPTNWIRLGVVSSAGTVTTNITVDAHAPRVASLGYSEDLKKIYIHWRRAGGAAPASVWLDGINVTSLTTTVGDPNLNFAASVISLSNALPFFSYHVFQGVYPDGKTATVSQRAWTNKFIYGSFNNFPTDANYTVAQWLAEASARGFNNIQHNLGDMAGYMATAAGRADCRARGYGYTLMDPGNLNALDPDMWFLYDEPDITEVIQSPNVCGTGTRLPCDSEHWPGTLVMREIEHGQELRAMRPNVPTVINLDGSLQPESFYIWGPAVDVLQSDNYYEVRLRDSQWFYPNRIPLFKNAKVSYAVSRTASTAAEPNPFNHLLYSVKWRCGNVNNCGVHYDELWPYPFPASKRMEAYYSLAGGAKGMGYWWFKGGNPSFGLVKTAECAPLWKEMGLVGNEIKTARNIIVKSTPVDLPLSPSANVWARAVASGTDTLMLYVVNDNYANDFNGCHVTNVPNATVAVTLPAWMQSGLVAFEITAGGLRAVNSQRNGNQLQITLGTLTLTRMIVLTTDPQLPLATHQRYLQQVRPNVCTFANELCGNAAPGIVVQPQSQVVLAGQNADFNVVANGTPTPTYQWRFNNANLAGATTASYTRANAQVVHGGGYSVVVSNSLGVVTSVVATLTVSTNGFPPGILTPPQSQSVEAGQDAAFTVTGSGTEPLRYQWRFNGAYISGATTNSYTRSNAQPGNAGNYDVVVTNAAGAVTSSVAALTVVIPCPAPGLLNPSFELGNTGGVGANWTGYQRAPNPAITLWSIQAASPPAGTGAQYQQIANTNATGGAGVRQSITGCVPGATYTISGWMRGNSGLYSTCTVKVSPTASTNWATAIHLNPAQTYTGDTWTSFSGTVVATSTSMTLWLDGQTTGSGNFKTECFDAVTVTCNGMPAPLCFELVQLSAPNQVRLIVSGPSGGSVTILRSSNLVHWVTATNLINTTGTAQCVDTISPGVPRTFYRATSP